MLSILWINVICPFLCYFVMILLSSTNCLQFIIPCQDHALQCTTSHHCFEYFSHFLVTHVNNSFFSDKNNSFTCNFKNLAIHLVEHSHGTLLLSWLDSNLIGILPNKKQFFLGTIKTSLNPYWHVTILVFLVFWLTWNAILKS